jgi:two-component system sensor histidine kinase HydH
VFDLFVEFKKFVGFTEADERALRAVHPLIADTFPAVSETFYARALEHQDARAALARGEKHVGQLKGTLVRWMNELLLGPWDEAYVQRRARIGRVHVQITLAQHYMVSAMNVVRFELRERVSERVSDGALARAARDALERICDLDLALMLHTYREDLESAQKRAERLSTFGQLVGSIGHELRNPLGVIETSLYVLKGRGSGDERTLKHLDRIGQQVVLANDIITQLLSLIRDTPLARERVDLGKIVADALTVLPEGRVAFERPQPTWIEGDAIQLRQVMVNLAQNADHFAGPAGRCQASIEVRPDGVLLTVDDSGPGIDPSIRNRLFEPLVTTRAGGIGLGLALVRRVVERHGGMVWASRGPLGGARFNVQLPPAGEAVGP